MRPQGSKQLPPSVVCCERPETEVVEPSASADRNPEISQGMAAGRSLSRSERKAAARAEFLRQEEQRERRRQVLRGCRKSRRAVLLEASAWQHALPFSFALFLVRPRCPESCANQRLTGAPTRRCFCLDVKRWCEIWSDFARSVKGCGAG